MQSAENRLATVSAFPVLPLVAEVERLANLYFSAIQLTEKARADSYHLAIAAVHNIDNLVSWNCSHIVSGRVRRTIEEMNKDQGIRTPILCTPEELMEV